MIKISEKDLLFIIINLISFMSLVVYMFLDFIAGLAQVMAAADPQYVSIEVGFSLLRVIAYALMVVIALLTLSCDMWFGYRCWKQGCAEYWRENL